MKSRAIEEIKSFVKFYYSGRNGFNIVGTVLFTPIIAVFIIPFGLLGLIIGKWEK
jgi:hypothetical protein